MFRPVAEAQRESRQSAFDLLPPQKFNGSQRITAAVENPA
jgi:hypothetical protein